MQDNHRHPAPVIALLMTCLCMSAARADLTNGLVAYYRFNGNANDESGHANHGTPMYVTLTTDRFGATNRCYDFDGVSSRVEFPETLFGPTAPEFTFSAWVKTSDPTSHVIVVGKGAVNGEACISVFQNTFDFAVKTDPTGWQNVATSVITNIFTHVVGVYQRGQSLSIYVNGLLKSSKVPIDGDLHVESPFHSAIGIYNYLGGPYEGFNGKIDDVRIYTRALNGEEVQELYRLETLPYLTIAVQTVRLDLHMEMGKTYQLESSANRLNWAAYGPPFIAISTNMIQTVDVAPGSQYFRILEVP